METPSCANSSARASAFSSETIMKIFSAPKRLETSRIRSTFSGLSASRKTAFAPAYRYFLTSSMRFTRPPTRIGRSITRAVSLIDPITASCSSSFSERSRIRSSSAPLLLICSATVIREASKVACGFNRSPSVPSRIACLFLHPMAVISRLVSAVIILFPSSFGYFVPSKRLTASRSTMRFS